ncbi:MAG: polysaccharide deacetylase family protein [Bacteroidales bacterium]
MDTIFLFIPVLSPRLKYTAEYLFTDLLGLQINWIKDPIAFASIQQEKIALCQSQREPLSTTTPVFLYVDSWISQPENRILEKTELEDTWTDLPFPILENKELSKKNSSPSAFLLNFDIFSAAFFLLSRYEEYRPKSERDQYGRYMATNSYLYQKGWLEKPVINIWVEELRTKLKKEFPNLHIREPKFRILPTIDIDRGFAFLHKPVYKIIGGFLKYPKEFILRSKVLIGLRKDPFHCIEEIIQLHQSIGLESKIFVLCGNYNRLDTGNAYKTKAYKKLFKEIETFNYSKKSNKKEGNPFTEIGIHLSISSNFYPLLRSKELALLKKILSSKIQSNRQHFIILDFPTSYKNLVDLDIKNDYSLGYPDLPGFRAGICTPFPFYDLSTEKKHALTIYPFCTMDVTHARYLGESLEEAFIHIRNLMQEVKAVNGLFIPLFHNESLSGIKPWKGWKEAYEKLLKENANLD